MPTSRAAAVPAWVAKLDGAGARRSDSFDASILWPVVYDEDLADRIREVIGREPDLAEKRMFGGLAFLIGGHLAVAANHEGAGSGQASFVAGARVPVCPCAGMVVTVRCQPSSERTIARSTRRSGTSHRTATAV